MAKFIKLTTPNGKDIFIDFDTKVVIEASVNVPNHTFINHLTSGELCFAVKGTPQEIVNLIHKEYEND